MAWQEELRKLDEELAAGRLSADDYRVRRDQVLSSAVTPSETDEPPAPGTGQNPNTTQVISPVNPANSGQPQGGAQPDPDNTQVASPWSGDQSRGVEPTQAVPNAGPARQPGYQPSGTPAGGFQPSGYQQPQPHQQPWNVPDQSAAPPWGGSDFPPIAPSANGSSAQQGPESFTTERKSKRGIAIAVAVVLLAAVGVGIWLIVQNVGGQQQAQPPASQQQPAGGTTSTAPTTTPKSLPELIPAPPGDAGANNGLLTLDEAKSAELLPSETVKALEDADVTELVHKKSTDGSFTYEVLAVATSGTEQATVLKKDLVSIQKDQGFVPGATGNLNKDRVVVLQQVKQGKQGEYHATYRSEDRVVLVSMRQEPIGDADKDLIAKFQQYAPRVAEAIVPTP